MEFHVGLLELITFVVALVGGGYTLITMSFKQFEKRLDEKSVASEVRLGERFKSLDSAVSDVKRLELELLRSDTKNAQTYMTISTHDKVLERIFSVLERMEKKLDSKADAAECDQKILRYMPRSQ